MKEFFERAKYPECKDRLKTGECYIIETTEGSVQWSCYGDFGGIFAFETGEGDGSATHVYIKEEN